MLRISLVLQILIVLVFQHDGHSEVVDRMVKGYSVQLNAAIHREAEHFELEYRKARKGGARLRPSLGAVTRLFSVSISLFRDYSSNVERNLTNACICVRI